MSVDVAADASQLDLVFNDGNGVWDNNSGGDWHFNVTGGIEPGGFVMDGVLDEGTTVALSEGGITLYWKTRRGISFTSPPKMRAKGFRCLHLPS